MSRTCFAETAGCSESNSLDIGMLHSMSSYIKCPSIKILDFMAGAGKVMSLEYLQCLKVRKCSQKYEGLSKGREQEGGGARKRKSSGNCHG
ncbi:hCG1997991 [Homo sapiens]|nr:hCG1997991 [Homo sapiens]